jgi:tripartite-type tricarboxylate transporter receptor subunit TctC
MNQAHKALVILAGALVLAGTAAAADYPSKPITLVVPFAPGGSNDIVARAIGKKLTEAWGQPVVIDNRAGAGGTIGAAAVATAAPDGHTLLLVSSTFTINAAIKKNLPFDALKDFAAVAFVARSPLLLTVSNKLPAGDVTAFIALATSRPVPINYASSGPGSINQIAAELIAAAAGIRLMHVPYKGGSLALNDLVGGHVDVYVSSLPQVLEIVRSGRARGLAVTSARRSPSLPGVPTLEESGVPGADAASWWGIVAPAGTPGPVIVALNGEINKTLTSPEIQRFMEGEGAAAEAMTPQQFGDLIRAETQRWVRLAREAHISID